jgi:hypothetical protein
VIVGQGHTELQGVERAIASNTPKPPLNDIVVPLSHVLQISVLPVFLAATSLHSPPSVRNRHQLPLRLVTFSLTDR